MSSAFTAIGFVGGLIMVAASFAHALAGWPAQNAALDQAGASAELIGASRIGWLWGSFCMLATGCAIVAEAVRGYRGFAPHRPVVVIVGALYVIFGVWAYIVSGHNSHFFGFMLAGALSLALLLVNPSRVQP